MRIALIAPAERAQTRRILRRLEDLAPGAAILLDASLAEGALPPGQRVEVGMEGVRWNGLDAAGFTAAYVHGFAYENPVLPPAEPSVDWAWWQAGHLRRQQTHSFLLSALSRLEAAGLPLWNPPSAHLAAFSRPALLDRLRSADIAVPETLCTNDAEAAEAFRARHGLPVWRPVTGPGPWQIFRPRQQRHLLAPDKPPVLLAAIAPGALVRAHVVGRAVALAHDVALPTDEGLERFELFRPLDPAAVAGIEAAVRAVAVLGLRFGAVTLAAAPDGAVVYDVDPDPVFTDQPAPVAERLIDALAHALLGRPLPAADLWEPAERPTLLTRRMLRLPFEMERSKHTEP